MGQWMSTQPLPIEDVWQVVSSSHKSYKTDLQYDYDYIIHLAPVDVDDVIECACRTDARILYASSGAVYDKKPDTYGRLKLQSEDKLLKSGLDVRIARMFSFIGHGLPEHLAPMRMLRAVQAKQPILAGDAIRSYMDAEDMARWLWAILLNGEAGGIYNVGSEESVTMVQLAYEIGKHSSGATIKRGEFKEQREYYVPDTSRTREELGVEITIPFEMAVERFVNAYSD